jgi:putative copper resistance protein D
MTIAVIFCGLLHTLAAMALFGGLAVRPVLGTPSGLAEHRLTLASALLALLTAVLWLLVEAGDMAGNPAAMFDPQTIHAVLGGTAFGHVWLGRLILAVAITVVALRRGADRWLLLFAAMQLASLGLIGHAAMAEGLDGAFQRVNQALHLLAGGAWLGALPPLMIVLGRAWSDSKVNDLQNALRRFSGYGATAVAVLLSTGAINVWVRTDGGRGLFTTPYGHTLLVKLTLVAAMVSLAVSNRFALTPRLTASSTRPLRWLTFSLIVETVIGALVLSAAFVLGNTEPP